ncbi:hypothetical protein [Paenibacillus kobensis]|uniref:hypothetical protein n=1 Tax=Paenibacillus kobensis TaxID=59841 RepID=UPI000FDA1D39|nr:hypothetical protein [Paenibacillus kobensis]
MVKITGYDEILSQLKQLGLGSPVYVWFSSGGDYYYLYFQGIIDDSIALFQGEVVFRIPIQNITAIAV